MREDAGGIIEKRVRLSVNRKKTPHHKNLEMFRACLSFRGKQGCTWDVRTLPTRALPPSPARDLSCGSRSGHQGDDGREKMRWTERGPRSERKTHDILFSARLAGAVLPTIKTKHQLTQWQAAAKL